MTFPKAHAGVKKIYAAQIISLIGAAVLLLVSIISILAVSLLNRGDAAFSLSLGAITTLLIPIGGAILLLVYFILVLIGIIQAKTDEPTFMKALICLILYFVASSLATVFTKYPIAQYALSAVGTAASLATAFFIILGIRKLARKLDRPDVDHRGVVTFRFLIISSLLLIVADILTIILAKVPSPVLTSIKSIVNAAALILNIVGEIIYLVFLKKAVRMLEA